MQCSLQQWPELAVLSVVVCFVLPLFSFPTKRIRVQKEGKTGRKAIGNDYAICKSSFGESFVGSF